MHGKLQLCFLTACISIQLHKLYCIIYFTHILNYCASLKLSGRGVMYCWTTSQVIVFLLSWCSPTNCTNTAINSFFSSPVNISPLSYACRDNRTITRTITKLYTLVCSFTVSWTQGDAHEDNGLTCLSCASRWSSSRKKVRYWYETSTSVFPPSLRCSSFVS